MRRITSFSVMKFLLTYQPLCWHHHSVMPTNAAPGPRYASLLQVLRTAETVWNASRVFFGRWDISPSQFNVLNLLRGSEGISQIELSTLLIMHRSNVTGLVDRLEERKLVKRQA